MRYHGQGRERPEEPWRKTSLSGPAGLIAIAGPTAVPLASFWRCGARFLRFHALYRRLYHDVLCSHPVLTVAGVTQAIAQTFNVLLLPFGFSTHLAPP